VNTPKEAASGRKEVKTPRRKASTLGAAETTSAKTASSAGRAGVGSKKKSGKVVGVETPTPARSVTAARAWPSGTPIKPASAVRPADNQASGRKTAGGKAVNLKGTGAGVSPNQPPKKSRRKKKAAKRKRLRTAAIGLMVTSVEGREAPKFADMMRRIREEVPDYKTFGIKWIRPRRTATGGLLMEIPGADSSQQADAYAARMREILSDEPGVRITRPVRRVELRISGFVESVTSQEIAEVVSGYGKGCPAEDVRVGAIRTSRDGLCTVWVQAPAVVGLPLADAGKLTLGGVVPGPGRFCSRQTAKMLPVFGPGACAAAVPLPGRQGPLLL